VTGVGGKVWVLGGFAGEEAKDMWAFDLASKTWEDWSESRWGGRGGGRWGGAKCADDILLRGIGAPCEEVDTRSLRVTDGATLSPKHILFEISGATKA
jgi:hypothetical protein